MAPIAQSTSRDGQYDGSGPRFASRRAWLEKFGEAEYAAYVKDRHKEDGSPQLNYEEWKASSHVLGPYLWHATMDVWDEDTTSGESSNDDEAPNLLSPPQQMPVRPKKPTTNGHGMRPSVKSNASTPRQLLVEPSESAKRKRKPKKQYLSQEIIASDDSDEVGDSASIIEAPAPPTPTITSNGTRRKPGARRKKQFLVSCHERMCCLEAEPRQSEETISPEDEIEDPISIDPIVKFPAKAANSAASESTAPLSKNKAPKPKTTRKYRKKYLSQETVPLDDDEDSAPAGIATPKNGSVTSPDGPGSMSASRRGLRTRTAAQQNPYQHNEKLFEDLIAVETLQQRETGIDGDEPLSEGAYAALEREETEVEDETPIGEEDVPSEETHLRRLWSNQRRRNY
ncbi:hypothetical protein P280DRAFT_308017 [Massarina eburnea CBS 473.64]|uniref:Uncharacterized protein n=1 Tax=Massarina eburnea CBS 473.64 TaxID=1395130 RepID=A0A6A6S3P1_9PLEO|nr:hypothetical protein P280DRAFT_308017 [Massarina eburnea CBS 473.64]